MENSRLAKKIAKAIQEENNEGVEVISGFVSLFYWVIVALFLGVGVMLVWNFVMPSVFGLGMINYKQALALYVLCDMLFKPGTHD